jgi:hypothetical protein
MKGYVLATRVLVEKKLPIMFMYRDMPEGDDTGWRFFAGFEDQEYVDEPGNIGIYDVSTILRIDPSIEVYLNAEAGSAFSRENGGEFERVEHDIDLE